MVAFEFSLKRNLLVRVEHNSDLIHFITDLAEDRQIGAATFTVIGALKRAKIGFYDQEEHEYGQLIIDGPQEIASCIGNISMKDGQPFVHAHAVLADEAGNTKAGHLLEGIVFAAEIHLQELDGPRLERRYDTVTGLSLWDLEKDH